LGSASPHAGSPQDGLFEALIVGERVRPNEGLTDLRGDLIAKKGLTKAWLELFFEFVNYTFIIYKVNRKISGDFPLFSISFQVSFSFLRRGFARRGLYA
jgi:hypothetical protein